ncbi:MAG TPA: hypothetical protein VE569_00360 [Acidimicrobiia bacterium]|nr:hypothetical protein [Acidimicrobiia bacterium]
MNDNEERHRLRSIFDDAAARYHRARPAYPEELLQAVIDAAELRSGDCLLEVGCATGKATIPFAQKGFRVTCVEIGPALADEA